MILKNNKNEGNLHINGKKQIYDALCILGHKENNWQEEVSFKNGIRVDLITTTPNNKIMHIEIGGLNCRMCDLIDRLKKCYDNGCSIWLWKPHYELNIYNDGFLSFIEGVVMGKYWDIISKNFPNEKYIDVFPTYNRLRGYMGAWNISEKGFNKNNANCVIIDLDILFNKKKFLQYKKEQKINKINNKINQLQLELKNIS